ncbi:MAG: DUF3017 domain-containing protein [Mycobacteriaceae bacterium]
MSSEAQKYRKARVIRAVIVQAPFIIVMGCISIAIVLVALDRWRRGAVVFGVATLAAASFRACLSPEKAGLLAVRSKKFDVAALIAFGVTTLWLAASIESLGTG